MTTIPPGATVTCKCGVQYSYERLGTGMTRLTKTVFEVDVTEGLNSVLVPQQTENGNLRKVARGVKIMLSR